jgi:hypothetical protein
MCNAAQLHWRKIRDTSRTRQDDGIPLPMDLTFTWSMSHLVSFVTGGDFKDSPLKHIKATIWKNEVLTHGMWFWISWKLSHHVQCHLKIRKPVGASVTKHLGTILHGHHGQSWMANGEKWGEVVGIHTRRPRIEGFELWTDDFFDLGQSIGPSWTQLKKGCSLLTLQWVTLPFNCGTSQVELLSPWRFHQAR